MSRPVNQNLPLARSPAELEFRSTARPVNAAAPEDGDATDVILRGHLNWPQRVKPYPTPNATQDETDRHPVSALTRQTRDPVETVFHEFGRRVD
jgi:hypothetical protein